MKQLSKYALKQLTDDELADYYAALESEESNTRRVCGGNIYIEYDSEYDEYSITSYDLDGYHIDERHASNGEELAECIELMEEELADIQDSREEDE